MNKLDLAQQAILTNEPEETLEMLYAQNKLEPSKHINPLTKHEFTGKNVWTLELTMLLNGYTSCNWSTFAQYKEANNFVDKGQKGTKLTLAVFGKEKDENGKDKEVLKFFRGYTVFNYEQTKAVLNKEETENEEELIKQEWIAGKLKNKEEVVNQINKTLDKWEQQSIFKIA